MRALSPRLVPVALSAGVTTLTVRAGLEPPDRMRATFAASSRLRVNVGLQPSARTDVAGGLDPAIEARTCGSRSPRRPGAYPEIIDATPARRRGARRVMLCLARLHVLR